MGHSVRRPSNERITSMTTNTKLDHDQIENQELKLPDSLTEINWVVFVAKLLNRDMNSRFTAIGFSAVGLLIGYLVSGLLVTAPAMFTALGLMIAAFTLKPKYVRLVIVILKDKDGKYVIDFQEWWSKTERQWPDSWRLRYKGKRVLVVDSIKEKPERFDPWAGQMPAGAGAASPTDLYQAQLEAGAIKDALAVERSMGESLRIGLLLAGIGGAGIAIILAADRLIIALGGTP